MRNAKNRDTILSPWSAGPKPKLTTKPTINLLGQGLAFEKATAHAELQHRVLGRQGVLVLNAVPHGSNRHHQGRMPGVWAATISGRQRLADFNSRYR